jgi:hypothetical protein
MNKHPLSFQSEEFTKEINVSSLVGKIIGGALTAIAVRWVIERFDEWVGKRS